MSKVEALSTDIRTAVKQMNRVRVATACSELIALIQKEPDAFSAPAVFKVLKLLRRKRMFAELERAADAYLEQYESPLIQTLRAQAIIDQGRLVAGLEAVDRAIAAAADPKSKAAEEARGLRARVYKQAFVQPSRRLPQGSEALREAIRAYRVAFELAEDDPVWPGVNLLALLVRAKRDQLDPGTEVTPQELAGRLEKLITQQQAQEAARAEAKGVEPDEQPWLLASRIEVSLARGEAERVVEQARGYLACLSADAFEFAATARQLREIWRLDEHEDTKVAAISTLLEAEVLRNGGGFVSDPARRSAPLEGGQVESVYGLERFKSYKWMRQGLDAADAVGRVENADGYGVGTGFLLRGRTLRAGWGERQLFLTNHHVICEEPGGAVRPEQAVVRFTSHDGLDGSQGVPVDKVEWFSKELDVAVVSLKRHVKKDYVLDVDIHSALAVTEPPARVYVIGHPRGEGLSYSMYDNEIVTYDTPYLFYRSPTLDGSSGSPLLSAQWTVLGIHHRGANPKYQANGGTLLRALLTKF
jgi:hypothetical protein